MYESEIDSKTKDSSDIAESNECGIDASREGTGASGEDDDEGEPAENEEATNGAKQKRVSQGGRGAAVDGVVDAEG